MADYTPTIPSKETVDFLYRGLVAFYPWTVFGEQKAKSMGFVKNWEGFESTDFTLLVTNITKTEDVDAGAKIILSWKKAWDKNAYPTATVPKNLDELVQELDEKSKTRGNDAQVARLAKKTLLESEVAKENNQIKISESVENQAEVQEIQPSEKSAAKKVEGAAVTKGAPVRLETKQASSPSETPLGITLQISKSVNLNPVGKVFLSAARLPYFLAGPAMAESSPEDHVTATAQNLLFMQGLTSSTFKTAIKPRALSLGISSSQIDRLIAEIAKQEKTHPRLFQTIKSSYDIQSIVVKAGISQAAGEQLFLQESGAGLAMPVKGLLGNVIGRVGQQLFGKLAKKVVGSAASKAVGEGVAEVVGATALSEIPIIGPIIGYIVGKVISKIVEKVGPFLKRYTKYVVGLPIALAGAGFLFLGGSAVLGWTMIGVGGGIAISPSGGVAAIGSSLGGAARFFFSNLLLPSIAKPLIATLIGIPVLVAVILFIINSGAYVVPPEELGGAGENPYISVTKDVGPQTSYENSDLPVTVTYTITVKAKKGTLENIKFNDDCEVIKEKETFKCESTLPEATPAIISPVEDYTFSVQKTYSGSRYNDSLIINSFSVIADTSDVKGTTSTGASSLIIGNPPTACYTFVGNWPANYRANVQAAITYLTGHWKNFMVKACYGGQEIQLKYEVSKGNYWGWASSGGHITLYKAGLGNLTNAIYILAHETGHIVSWRIPNIMKQFLDTKNLRGEEPICSYSATTNPYEAFAESAALYGSPKTFYCMNNSFQSKYPYHYDFAESVIFK